MKPTTVLQLLPWPIALAPLGWLGIRFANGALGANPIEAVIRELGQSALWLLLATLAVSPLRRRLGWPPLAVLRRPLGLLTCGYALLHLGAYGGLDQAFFWPAIAADLTKRPFMTLGLAALLLMLPLAATSPRAVARRLGATAWRRLHRLVHPIALLALLHHYWLIKADYRPALVETAVLTLLWGERLVHGVAHWRNRVARMEFTR
ncbi:MAG: ferric reductase-like transmembrane domain-containing protein [Magnetococcales bacterium]|nr:ferric reductase-like transmembrane domain-containing protein [Magnetococcales bacterium]